LYFKKEEEEERGNVTFAHSPLIVQPAIRHFAQSQEQPDFPVRPLLTHTNKNNNNNTIIMVSWGSDSQGCSWCACTLATTTLSW